MKSDFGIEFIPRRMTEYSAGYDFFYPHDEPLTLYPNHDYVIDTGIHLEDGDISNLEYLGCTPRSSMRRDYGMSFDGEMVIDADYRDSIKVYLHVRKVKQVYLTSEEIERYAKEFDMNRDMLANYRKDVPLTLNKGDRFMQGIVKSYGRIANEIPPNAKRTGGTGSTDQH